MLQSDCRLLLLASFPKRAILTCWHEHYSWLLVPRHVKHRWFADEGPCRQKAAYQHILCFRSAEAAKPSTQGKVATALTQQTLLMANIAC